MRRFIVGTGRCGSTLLSRMLRCNPEVLDVSEFYSGLDWNRRFERAPMSGPEFWDLISAPHPFITMVLERGYLPPEVTYPFERLGARYSRPDPLPLILAATLPPLFDDVDRAFDELRGFTIALPARPAAAQAEALFEWLAERSGRSVWIERSGGAITWMSGLHEAFPGARFLHLHRAGEEAALSMRDHPVFRLAVMLTYGIPVGERGGIEELGQLGEDADHVARLLASSPPPKPFGDFWTEQIGAGFRALGAMDDDQYSEVRFEDLLTKPEDALAQVATFLDIPDPCGPWRRDAAALAAGAIRRRFDALAGRDQAALADACRPGNRLLGRR